MKIVSWNLRNIGPDKLTRQFPAAYSAFGLGGNVLDYITKVVTGNAAWSNIQSARPADIFVIIELRTGGQDKGADGSNGCLVVLPSISNALNSAVAARADVRGSYSYKWVKPLVTGFRETIGIIYNEKALTLKTSEILTDLIHDTPLSPRTPFAAEFALVSNPATSLYVAGIHSPPPKGTSGLKYRDPINYNRLLINTGCSGQPGVFFAGDFNCTPSSSFPDASGNPVKSFTNIPTFGTLLADGTKSSLLSNLDDSQQPAAYLSAAYDNIIYNFTAPASSTEIVADLIGNARDMNSADTHTVFAANEELVFDTYRDTLSDHLPVIAEFNF
ncbi:MAG TPA: hypothetical protein VK826_06435 [Bacteroidia bacterium]|nr:hypothetical protein [Bacteroidia bacterium]